jgi:hypothetical protein
LGDVERGRCDRTRACQTARAVTGGRERDQRQAGEIEGCQPFVRSWLGRFNWSAATSPPASFSGALEYVEYGKSGPGSIGHKGTENETTRRVATVASGEATPARAACPRSLHSCSTLLRPCCGPEGHFSGPRLDQGVRKATEPTHGRRRAAMTTILCDHLAPGTALPRESCGYVLWA